MCDIQYSVHVSLVFCFQKISVCSDDISLIMTSFIDDLSQLNVKQGTTWVVQMLHNVKNCIKYVLHVLCTVMLKRSQYVVFNLRSTGIYNYCSVVFHRYVVDSEPQIRLHLSSCELTDRTQLTGHCP